MSTAVIPYSNNNNKYINTNTGEISILGTTAKSVHNEESSSAVERRALRFRLQNTARALLPQERVAQCMHRCGQGGVAINVSLSSGIASFAGVVTCGSVWTCPVCSNKISNGRRKELNTILEWARQWGYQPVLMTLTARHGIQDSLAGMLRLMKLAKQKFHRTREWVALSGYLIGHVTATEVTHGANGWHVHYHMLMLVDAKTQADALSMCDLQSVWLRVLNSKSIQLGGNGYAFDAQGASAAGDYISKWGAAEEIALTGSKQAGGKGSTPFQLLATSATAGSGSEADRAAQLFKEYAKEFKGKRQLVWSKGFKRVLNIIEKSDEELSDEPEADDLVEIAIVPKKVWRMVVRRNLQAELLSVAEEGGAHYVDIWCQALILQTERGFKHGS